MSHWPAVSLAEISDKPQYGAIARGTTTSEGPLFVRQTDISTGRIDWSSVPYCDLDHADVKRYALKRGDLLISRLGNGVGNAATVTEDRNDAIFAGYLVRFQPKPGIANAEFVGYVLQSRAWKDHVNGFRSGAAQPTLNAQQMGEFRFLLPPLPDQLAIAMTLGSLDRKIDSNRGVIDLIPKLIRARIDEALSKDLDPVAVANLASFVNGGAFTKGATGTGRMVLRIAELNSGPGPSTVYNDIQVPIEKTANPGEILMSWSGSLGVYRWFREEAIINQHIFKVIPTGYPAWLVYDRLDAAMPAFRDVAADKATTMGHIQRGHLVSTTTPMPPSSVIDALDFELSPLWERLLLADREVLRLERLRDALLPELLSGRLSVSSDGAP